MSTAPSDQPQPIPLQDAYMAILGGVMAISPDLYDKALDKIARLSGRTNDEKFKKEVYEISKSMPCDLD